MVFNQGLVGPKAKPKDVADGQSVNIPTLGYFFNKLHNVVILADYGFHVLGPKRNSGQRKVGSNISNQSERVV